MCDTRGFVPNCFLFHVRAGICTLCFFALGIALRMPASACSLRTCASSPLLFCGFNYLGVVLSA